MSMEPQQDYNYNGYNQKPYRQNPFTRMNVSVTMGLVALNILVFLIIELTGSTEDSAVMVRWGAMFTPYIQEKGEYWRMFTALFLHFGIRHLLNNMLLLYVLGITLEETVGKIRYLLIYLIAGLGANVVSYALNVKQNTAVVSAGASGGVFAVLGALIWVLIANRGRLKDYTLKNLIFMAMLSLYFGFASSGVDNAAHVAGLLFGFLLSFLLYRRQP